MAMSKHPVVLVTGASKGLGLEVARLLLQSNARIPAANVVTLSRSIPEELRQLSDSNDKSGSARETRLETVQGDVTSESDNERAVNLAITKWGRLDGVVLNAGIIDFVRIADKTNAQFMEELNVNLVSLLTTLRHALPHLRKSPTGCGKVVFTSSGASTGNYAGWSAYNASKAGGNALIRTLANEERNIAAWSIRPGVLATEMQALLRSKGKESMDETAYNKFITLHKEGKLVDPVEPAHVLAALAVRGTRTEPKASGSGSEGLGGEGAYINWEDEALEAYQRQK